MATEKPVKAKVDEAPRRDVRPCRGFFAGAAQLVCSSGAVLDFKRCYVIFSQN